MKSLLAINGGYREDGLTDRLVEHMLASASASGAQTHHLLLREHPIEFCLNCRACMQEPGATPGNCVHHDNMQDIVRQIEAADAFILASPTNFGSVTALFKRFMERLAVYGYWPWGEPAPKPRREQRAIKKAALVSSCAAPALLGRVAFHSVSDLKLTAKTLGAMPQGVLFTGFAGQEAQGELPQRLQQRAQKLAHRLIS
jgi:putative NADPH-quinone reductase